VKSFLKRIKYKHRNGKGQPTFAPSFKGHQSHTCPVCTKAAVTTPLGKQSLCNRVHLFPLALLQPLLLRLAYHCHMIILFMCLHSFVCHIAEC
jgi:hypothetical protein